MVDGVSRSVATIAAPQRRSAAPPRETQEATSAQLSTFGEKKFTMLRWLVLSLIVSSSTFAQDSIVNIDESRVIKLFSSSKAINVRTTEVTGRGKMDFNVGHNFGDIAGDNGGIKRFFGLDNATDIRIGFHIGVGERSDIIFSRSKGAGVVQNLWELGFKHQLLRQRQDDPRAPISLAIFANAVVSTQKRGAAENQDNSFTSLADRTSNIIQLIIGKKIGSVSVLLSPTYFTRGYAISYDQKNMFALGGAIRLPLSHRLNLVVDYVHPFRNESSRDSFSVNQNLKFFDPLGIGFEILTSGHIFRLNFTNATEIMDNRYIPRTISSWGEGEFRWGFTISRNFTIWRKK